MKSSWAFVFPSRLLLSPIIPSDKIGFCLSTQSYKVEEFVKEGYRLLLVDKDGVLVSEFQLAENDLAHPEAFVAALRESIESVEEEEP